MPRVQFQTENSIEADEDDDVDLSAQTKNETRNNIIHTCALYFCFIACVSVNIFASLNKANRNFFTN